MQPTPIKLLILLFLAVSSGLAFAHSGATGIVKMRMDMMSDIADQMKTISKMVKGETVFDAGKIEAAAKSVEDHAGNFEKMFPSGSIKGPSEALPAIWKDWDAFAELTSRMKSKATTVAEVAKGASRSEEVAASFIELGATCKSCHQKYRKKKE